MKTSKLKLHLIGGARPNFIKIAPLLKLLDKNKNFETIFVNTGQHYNNKLYYKILEDLGLRLPDVNLNVGSCSSNTQFSKIMSRYEKFINKNTPDLVIVFGDVNSTLAAALTAKKMEIKIAHVESGLRCYDDSLPEEINRRLTDSISDYYFIPTKDEEKKLRIENIKNNIFFVGNIMMDSLKFILKNNQNFKIQNNKFGLITFHRPENVDCKLQFSKIIEKIREISKKENLIFPIHPRTKKSLKNLNLYKKLMSVRNLKLYESFGYLKFLMYLKKSDFVITDSGGVQEESTFLGVPCFTLRKNTERPITISKGTNCLVNLSNIVNKIQTRVKKNIKIDKWDGQTANRIIKILEDIRRCDFQKF